MTTYIVTFEVPDYTRKNRVKEKLKEFGFYCPIHDSAWAIRAEKKASEIRDIVSSVMAGTDRIFVIRTGTEAAWRNAYGLEHNDWLRKHL